MIAVAMIGVAMQDYPTTGPETPASSPVTARRTAVRLQSRG